MFCLAEPPRTLEARVCSGSVVGRRERREAGRADRAREVSAPSGEGFGLRVRGGDVCRCGNRRGDPLSLLKRRPGGSRACRPDCSASTEVRRAIPSAATPKRRKLSHSPRLREPHPGPGVRGFPTCPISCWMLSAIRLSPSLHSRYFVTMIPTFPASPSIWGSIQ